MGKLEPTKEEKTILGLMGLIIDLNPRLSQFKPFMPYISHAEKIEKKYAAITGDNQ